jgi:hypothetical protein
MMTDRSVAPRSNGAEGLLGFAQADAPRDQLVQLQLGGDVPAGQHREVARG